MSSLVLLSRPLVTFRSCSIKCLLSTMRWGTNIMYPVLRGARTWKGYKSGRLSVREKWGIQDLHFLRIKCIIGIHVTAKVLKCHKMQAPGYSLKKKRAKNVKLLNFCYIWIAIVSFKCIKCTSRTISVSTQHVCTLPAHDLCSEVFRTAQQLWH